MDGVVGDGAGPYNHPRYDNLSQPGSASGTGGGDAVVDSGAGGHPFLDIPPTCWGAGKVEEEPGLLKMCRQCSDCWNPAFDVRDFLKFLGLGPI